jgi:cytochrome c-type biogenesis protein CcmH
MLWLVTGAMAVMVAAALLLASRRGPAEEAAPDARVYRDQLKDIARDVARGVIPEAEAERLRAEVGRRLLAVDGTPRRLAPGPAGALAGLLALAAGGAVAAYAWLGAPGYPDLPLSDRLAAARQLAAERPSQAAAEAAAPVRPAAEADPEFLDLMGQLRARLKARPNDLHGHRLLAENEARLGNLVAAREAQERVVAILGDAATAADRAMLARLMVAAAGGMVTPEAEAVLAAALSADQAQPEALFLAGIGQMQIGRPDLGFRLWRQFLAVVPPDSPFRDEVAAQMPALALAAGEEWQPAPGPTAADVAAAGEMSAADRQAMAEGMVEQLAGRLASEGGTAADWARLIGALGVLGQTDRARAIYEEAATTFAGRAEDLALLAQAAEAAGLAP